MNIVRDMFGAELFEGDTVVYADARIGTDEIGLDMYEIHSIVDGIIQAVLMSGEYMGNLFYLETPESRCARIRNPYKSSEVYSNTLLS